MAAAREREQEEQAEAAAPEAAAQAPVAVPVGPMNPAGVMALQRLVGNSAVTGMLDERREPGAAESANGAAAPGQAAGAAQGGASGAGVGQAAGAAQAGAYGAEVGQAAGAAQAGAYGAEVGQAAEAGAAGGAVGQTAQAGASSASDVGAAAGSAAGAAGSSVAQLPGAGGVLEAFEAIVRGTAGATPAEGAQAGAPGAGATAAEGAQAGANGAAGVTPAEGAAGPTSIEDFMRRMAGGVLGGANPPGGAAAVEGAAAGGAAGAAGAAVEGAAAGGAAGAAGAAVEGAAAGGAAGAAGAAVEGAAAGGAAGAAAAGGVAGAAGGAAGAAAGGGVGAVAASAKAGAAQEGAAAGAAPAAGGAAAAGGQQAAGGGGGAAAGGSAAAAEAAPARAPEEDPNFQAMKGKAGAAGAKAKAHQPAAAGASAAQAAAQPPGNDVASQAAGHQVEEMGKQQPGTFDRKAFIAAVKKAIDAAAPKNLEEADDFKDSGKAGKVKDEVGGLVKGGKKDSEKDIKQATDAPPDASKATPKQVVPLSPDEPGAATSSVGAAASMPGPRPAEETDLSAGPAEVDQQMVDAEVTDEQLQRSNEPEFTGALDARQEAKEHATSAPLEYRAQESEILEKGREEATAAEGMHLKGMQGAKLETIAKVAGEKGETKSQDESKRAKVAADIQAIYDKTKTDVTGILTALDGKVDATFTRGEASARQQFEDYVGTKMAAYKEDRYSGWFGGARWLKDKLFGMPDAVNAFYSDGRDAYMTTMDGVIGEVADLVGNELNAARLKIAAGRAEVHDYVTQLPQDLQKVGKDAEGKLDQQWDDLSSDVDNKQDAMVDTIAQKYVASRDALNDRIEELKAANKGLVAKALDAVVGVIKTILKLKDMLLNVLAKAADVIGDIITDPIGFLGNLIGGIKDGLSRFVDNIGTHLQNGLMGWLFGALGDAGIKMPKTFDLAGIFELVMDVLGLSYRSIRGRVAKIVGEPVVEKMEGTVDVFKKLATEGVAGLWDWIKDKIGDFQELVLGGIKDFIIERVIKGGITWLLSLLNPAAAFIKACQAIYNIVMFIVERGSQIMEFVNSVLDSIGAIARGQLSVAAEKVESALAKALPLAISFLASLLNLGGITDKIREGIDKVRKPIEKAVDFVVLGAVKGFKKLFGGAVGWVKDKAAKGKQWATDKATAAKEWGAGKVRGIKDRFTGKDDEAEAGGEGPIDESGPDTAKSAAVKAEAGREVREKTAGPLPDQEALAAILADIKTRLQAKGLKELRAVEHKQEPGKYDVVASASEAEKVGEAETATSATLTDEEKDLIRQIPGFPRGTTAWVSMQADVRSGAGAEFLAEYETLNPDRRRAAVEEARIALAHLAAGHPVFAIGMELMRWEGKGKKRVLGTVRMTEIDVETDEEIIQVKGGDFTGSEKLEDADARQLVETVRYNEQYRWDAKFNKLPQKRVVFQFTAGEIPAKLRKWLEDRDVVVRIGLGA